MKTNKFLLMGVIAVFLMVPMAAMADTIDPASFSATLGVDESVEITKTVTIEAGELTTATLDVLFLVDTTGSMGGLISSAKAAATDILTGLSGLGDVAFAVAAYDDFPVAPYGYASYGDQEYYELQEMTTSTTLAQAGIDALTTHYGGDGPESQLYALYAASTEIEWREDSTKVIVWFGDYTGHDADLESAYAAATGSDVGLQDAVDALTAEGIIVHAVDLYSMDSAGQATYITGETGGTYSYGYSSGLATTIQDAVEATFESYSTVALEVLGDHSGVDVAISPEDYTGDYDRETEETFTFDVTFTGTAAGTYDFEIAAVLDGKKYVAREKDSITVTGEPSVPEPGTMFLLGAGILGVGIIRKRIK